MSSDFTTTYQTSTGFLSGQSLITTITAIQIMQDQSGFNPTVMAVFGLGADGVTPYVGYVTMQDSAISGSQTLPVAAASVRCFYQMFFSLKFVFKFNLFHARRRSLLIFSRSTLGDCEK